MPFKVSMHTFRNASAFNCDKCGRGFWPGEIAWTNARNDYPIKRLDIIVCEDCFCQLPDRFVRKERERMDVADIPVKPEDGIYDFGDVAPDVTNWDLKHSDILNLPVVILSFEEGKGPYGKLLVAHCMVEGEEKRVLVGGEVLIKQLEGIPADKFPVRAKVVKTGSYYQFSSAKAK